MSSREGSWGAGNREKGERNRGAGAEDWKKKSREKR